MPRSQTGLKLTVVLSRVRWIIAIAILAGVALPAIALRLIGTTTVSAQITDDQIAAPEATTVISGNLAPITINDNSTASLYPSEATVSGVNTSITRVRVQLNNFSHTFPDDVDIILEGPQGQRAMVMSDAGAGIDVNGQTLTFDSTAALSAVLPDELPLTTGTFRAANYGNTPTLFTDTFPAPFPAPNTLTDAPADLSVFHQTNPNGQWKLYVVDDAGTDVGTIAGGWTLLVMVPAIFSVNSTNDPGNGVCDGSECTLREAINAAIAAPGNSDQISFDSSFNTPKTIDLLTPLPDITESMAIAGPGANLLTVRRSFNAVTDFRIFTIPIGITTGVAISGMTITGGRDTGPFGGGGIYSQSLLTLANVHVTGNQASNDGGGVLLRFADGLFTRSTFSDNRAGDFGGGIATLIDDRTLRLVSSTISGNVANTGGGIMNNANASSSVNSILEVIGSTIANNTSTGFSPVGGIATTVSPGAGALATTTLRNTIVANNTPNNLAKFGSTATFTTNGFNLSDNYNGVFTPLANDITSATPRLAPLALYGGQTPTHALLGGSPAIDAGNSSGASTDQRGRTRPFDLPFAPNVNGTDGADIGAVEMYSFFLVTNAGGVGSNSLRDAVGSSPTNSDILFDPTFFNTPRTITLGGTELVLDRNLNIIAPGANLVTVSGGNQSRVFNINSGSTATLSEMTITGGNGSGGGGGAINVFSPNTTLNLNRSRITGNTVTNGNGGGLLNSDNAVVNISDSTFDNNTSTFNGGAIQNETATLMTIRNTTISGNTANSSSPLGGGGIHQTGTGTLTINNSTITNNTAAGNGGGIRMANGSINVRNTIIAGNIDASGGNAPNIFGTFVSNGFNLIGNSAGGSGFTNGVNSDQVGSAAVVLNPGLASLALNGGQMPTHALLFASPALDKGNSSGATSDQRGLRRPVDLPATNAPNSDGSDIGAFEAQTAPVAQNRAPFDYDGDNKTDISIFRPGPGEWWLSRSSNGSNFATQFGSSSDKIVPADFTGDGKADIAFWRPSNGNWFVLRSEDLTFFAFPFGTNGTVPVPEDFDGDLKADAAVFRPSTLTWIIPKSTGGVDFIGFGALNDKPAVADYTGDGKADIAIFRPNGGTSEWWVRRSSDGSVFALQFGASTDRPVPGDFTGDGKADIAFWRPSNGNWFVLRSEDFSFFAFPFGTNGDVPAPGDYDGDGKFDAGVFRPSNFTWFIDRSTAGTLIQTFGIAGDIPTPSAYIP
ncbi:MAG: CSLREA domain-containing protein [Acidobacteria bacterium]|nr:CSLREA domain-containing protein [Acidobacteriota bacterium]